MLRYCGPFAFPLSIPLLFYGFGPAAPFATVGTLLAALIGAEAISPRGQVNVPSDSSRGFRNLIILYIPLQLGLICWSIAASTATTWVGIAALVLSVGVTTGVFGMLTAHEAVHSNDPFEQSLGTAMLTGMVYRHFRVAHIHGHHRWTATDKDPGTARLGEGFYGFLIRTVKEQFVLAFDFEKKRCRAQGLSIAANTAVTGLISTVVIFGLIFFLAGWRGLLFFLLQSAVAVTVLELFNYIAHYGLVRYTSETGQLQPVSDFHSWNSSNILANTLIFNMGRHSFHHLRPSESYQSLKQVAAAPELPAGYAGSILLALAPPLWRRRMDPEARRIAAGQSGTGIQRETLRSFCTL